MKRIFLTQEDVLQLRKEIVLNSIYFSDYENHWGIDTHTVSDFFDGYISFIDSEAKENGEDLDAEKLFEKYDNDYYLTEWCGCFADEFPLYYDEQEYAVEFLTTDEPLRLTFSLRDGEIDDEDKVLENVLDLAIENELWDTYEDYLECCDEDEDYKTVYTDYSRYFLRESAYKLTRVA